MWLKFIIQFPSIFSFKKPYPVDIVIWDSFGSEWIQRCFPNVRTKILYVRGELFNVHPRTIFHTLRFRTQGFATSTAYVLAMLTQWKPELVVTFNDNSNFHKYSCFLPETPFIAIQNGWRFPGIDDEPLPRGVTYNSELLCFGKNEIDEYHRRNTYFKSIHGVGSLRNSLWLEHQSGNQELYNPTTFDICLISEFRHGSIGGSDSPMSKRSEECVKMLGEYLNNRPDLSVAVALIYSGNANSLFFNSELQFYKKYLGDSAKLIPRDEHEFNVYSIGDRSNVIVCSSSTAGIEALARGRKVLLTCNFFTRTADVIHRESQWNFQGEGAEDFKRCLDLLLATPREAFWNSVSKSVSYLMLDPRKFSTAEFLRERIESHLKNRPYVPK